MKVNHRRKTRVKNPYRGSKVFDRSCRNHGSCNWCECQRLFKRRQVEEEADEQLKEYYDVNLYHYSHDEYNDTCFICYDEDSFKMNHSDYWKEFVNGEPRPNRIPPIVSS